jgi:Flp pilus assembly protein CpaB
MPPALRLRTRTPSEGARGALPRLPGPPFLLPGIGDRIAEGWWRLTPRARTLLLSAAVLLSVAAVLLRIALAPYGPPVPVLLTTGELAVGASPGPTDVTAATWPRGLLPLSAPATREDLAGARLTMGVAAGTVLTRAHLRDDGPLAGLSAGAAAVPVPPGLLRGAREGARLDLVAVSGDGSGRTLARDVRVLAVEQDAVWLEVARDRAADVAAAALRGTLSGAVLAE